MNISCVELRVSVWLYVRMLTGRKATQYDRHYSKENKALEYGVIGRPSSTECQIYSEYF